MPKGGQQESKFFVVSPTSVIYHWEDLLAKVSCLTSKLWCSMERNGLFKSPLISQVDILLTSYGTLRSEREEL